MKTLQRKTAMGLVLSTSCTVMGFFTFQCLWKTLKLHYFTVTIPNKTNSDDNQSQKTFLQIFDIFIFQKFCTRILLGLLAPTEFLWIGAGFEKKNYMVWNLEKKEEFTWGYDPVSKKLLCWKFKVKMLGVQ